MTQEYCLCEKSKSREMVIPVNITKKRDNQSFMSLIGCIRLNHQFKFENDLHATLIEKHVFSIGHKIDENI